MKLYYAPGACSLADHVALHEAGLSFDHEQVDLKAKRTESGADYTAINPKGYVPALTLDTGETLTENVAILDWIAHKSEILKPSGDLGHTRLLETLAFISTEVHKSFKPFFQNGSDEEKEKAKEVIQRRLNQLAASMKGDYLFGTNVSVADCYLFVMTLWAKKFDVGMSPELAEFQDRMMVRPAVQKTMGHEGLI